MSRDLCAECQEAGSPEAKGLSAELRDARCEYCGGEGPIVGGTDFLSMITGIQKLKFTCIPCATEHRRFVEQQLTEDTSRLSQQQQLALLRKVRQEADEHMKRWVSERDKR